MLDIANTVLVIVDVQERLARVIHDRDQLLINLQKLISGAQVLDIPIILTEQYPQGLGQTVPEVAHLLPETKPITKLSFSCCGEQRFLGEVETLNRPQVLVAGIESHVCVYQTVIDLLERGYEVQVVVDSVSSRTVKNREISMEKMKSAGASLTSTEMALFELLKVAEGDKFKKISKIVK
ncbi:hydrolase [Chloroflexota bacterium]